MFDSHRGQAYFQACPVWITLRETSQTLYLYEIYKVETSKSAHSNMFFINQILRYYPPGLCPRNRWGGWYWGGYGA